METILATKRSPRLETAFVNFAYVDSNEELYLAQSQALRLPAEVAEARHRGFTQEHAGPPVIHGL